MKKTGRILVLCAILLVVLSGIGLAIAPRGETGPAKWYGTYALYGKQPPSAYLTLMDESEWVLFEPTMVTLQRGTYDLQPYGAVLTDEDTQESYLLVPDDESGLWLLNSALEGTYFERVDIDGVVLPQDY